MKNKKIIIASILLIAVVVMLNINLNKKEQVPMAITENFTTLTFNVDDDINEDISKAYKRNLETLPEELKKYATSINITNENLSEKFELNLKANILAISYGSDIYINGSKFNKNVLIHELFHVFDYSNNWISTSKKFTKIYNKEKNFVKVSDGNVQNNYEFFASAGEIYYFNPDKLKEIAPLTYKFFNENLPI